VAAPRKYLNCGISQVDLNPVAIELDLVNPPLAGRYPLNRRCQRRFNEAGITNAPEGWNRLRDQELPLRGFRSSWERLMRRSTQQELRIALAISVGLAAACFGAAVLAFTFIVH
jgi:hypothetical protein